MMADIFSVFDDQNGTFMGSTFLVWLMGSILIFMVFSKMWAGLSRWEVVSFQLSDVVFSLLSRTKGSGLGGFASLICSLFSFIIIFNLLGLIPYVFSPTSHLVFSFTFAVPLWLSLLLSSVKWNYYSFVAHFLPSGAPSGLNPFLVIVELVSVMVRPVTLSIRLAANMGAGHIVLTLVGGFLTTLMGSGISASVVFLYLINSFYFIFEVAICCIQGYIFCLLLMLYSDEHS
uniref:ATP synthase subunit a n=1 Tax=Phoronopsis harmeri TaxID=490051 RepID=J9PMY0_9BILA|nr:ATP synthase F0 subunit 6 [Phoronopsis harmeri]AES86293.1 ATP synthase F0 subunit 6 [Phoronopsis harmeri]